MVNPFADRVAGLRAAVQHNCHIADARHARDYSLCIYLLKMREYFRWEQGYGFADRLPREAIGEWMTRREQLWQELEESDYQPIELDGQRLDPFDSAAVNAHLLPLGLVYSGGIGGGAHTHFFLAELVESDQHAGTRLLVAGREYARDISAPPAMTQAGTLFIRRESLRRLLWEKVEEWQWRRQEGPMARAMAAYPFDADFDRALEAMTDTELRAVVLHEMGEVEAGRALGPEWEVMLARAGRSHLELLARAARDHLADCLVTLPELIEREALPSLHFYIANLGGMRRELFPALRAAYDAWQRDGRLAHLAAAVAVGRSHWAEVTAQLLARCREEPEAVPASETVRL